MTFTTPDSWGSSLAEAWSDLREQTELTKRRRRRRWIVWSGKQKVASAPETPKRPPA